MLKRFIKWCLALEETHSTTIFEKSLTGEPLLVFEHRGWHSPLCLRTTPLGHQGAYVASTLRISFHTSIDNAKKLLRGEFDNCLCEQTKADCVGVIRTIVETNKGKYGSYAGTPKGTYTVQSFELSNKDKAELTELLRASYNG